MVHKYTQHTFRYTPYLPKTQSTTIQKMTDDTYGYKQTNKNKMHRFAKYLKRSHAIIELKIKELIKNNVFNNQTTLSYCSIHLCKLINKL